MITGNFHLLLIRAWFTRLHTMVFVRREMIAVNIVKHIGLAIGLLRPAPGQ